MCKAKRHNRKKSNMLSGVIGRHQNRDDRRYIQRRRTHMSECVDEDCYNHNRKQLVIKNTTVGDDISETCQEELRRIALTHMQEEQQQTNTVTEEDVQVTHSYDEVEATCAYTYAGAEVEITDTKSTSMPKINKWKWIAGTAAGTVLAGMIAYIFKTK